MVKIFISYASADEDLKNKLDSHLSVLKRNKKATVWHRKKINAGADVDSTINTHLHAADIILLLVSADYLGSDYCYDNEMKFAIERHEREEAIVIPVIL